MNRFKKSVQEILLGFLIGILLSLLIGIRAFAAVNSPADVQRNEAERYLQSEGIEIPEEIEFWAEYYGDKYGICPEVIEAVCWVESNCKPTAQSQDKECKGLMQIKPACHRDRMDRLNARNVFAVSDNIKIGTDYLAELGGSEEIAVALTIYNGQSEAKIESARRGQLSEYVKKILKISAALERINGK